MMLIGSLSLIGFPFFTGFYSKEVILELQRGLKASIRKWIGLGSKYKKERSNMSFTQLFPQYNSSLNPLCGSAIQCLVKKLWQNMILVNIGLKTPIICFQHELKRVPITKQTIL
jgi:hypothetical protein